MSVGNDGVDALLRARPVWANNLILAGLRGSDSHGTKLPDGHPMHTDDVDTFGVSVQSPEWYMGLGGYSNSGRQVWETAGEHYDHLIYDVRTFFSLLLKGNPNVLCWLWAHPDDVPLQRDSGRRVIAERSIFMSSRCFDALAGYAQAQITRMENKRFEGYQGEKRRALVEQIGYDTKHAAHCLRLLNMGVELAETGGLSARRPPDEAAVLMDVKAGEYDYGDVKKMANEGWVRFREAEAGSTLPGEPDYERASALLVEVIETVGAR